MAANIRFDHTSGQWITDCPSCQSKDVAVTRCERFDVSIGWCPALICAKCGKRVTLTVCPLNRSSCPH